MVTEDVTDIVSRLAYHDAPDGDLRHAWRARLPARADPPVVQPARQATAGGDDPVALMVAHRAMHEFRHYVEDILVPHPPESRQGSDLLTALLDAEESARLSPVELTAMFVVLLFAGHETTTNLISIGRARAAAHTSDQWDRLCADPSLAPAGDRGVAALGHARCSIQWRATRADLEVDGFDDPQPANDGRGGTGRRPIVIRMSSSMPRRSISPGTDAKQHLSTRTGSRISASATHWRAWRVRDRLRRSSLERFPEMELVDDEPAWQGNAMMRGPTEVLVRLGPERWRPAVAPRTR